MRKLIKKLSLALWAFKNPDNLTMLKWDLKMDMAERNSQGRRPLTSCRAERYRHYLSFKEE